MALIDLTGVSRTSADWLIWSFSNQDSHQNASNAIFSQRGVNIPRYPLDPIPAHGRGGPAGAPGPDWLYNHQLWHNLINSELNTPGVDLTAVDFGREDQAQAWAFLHYNEHLRWTLILGLT